MGAYGANYGASYAGFATVTTGFVKTISATLCVTTGVKKDLCVNTSIKKDLCVNTSIKEDLCV